MSLVKLCGGELQVGLQKLRLDILHIIGAWEQTKVGQEF
jgi:hypothetical protein